MREEVKILNSFWSENYVCERRQSQEMLLPEDKLISQEENPIWKMIMTIYLEQGAEELIRYYFVSLRFKKTERTDIILEFFKKMSTPPLKLKIPIEVEKSLIRKAQIQRNNDYTMRLGKAIFGQAKFVTMVRARV